jgi:hypothetical protein
MAQRTIRPANGKPRAVQESRVQEAEPLDLKANREWETQKAGCASYGPRNGASVLLPTAVDAVTGCAGLS